MGSPPNTFVVTDDGSLVALVLAGSDTGGSTCLVHFPGLTLNLWGIVGFTTNCLTN